MAVQSPPAVGAADVPEEIQVICPQCRTHWANARIRFGQAIKKTDFAIRNDLKGQVSFDKKSGLPFCPVCSFEYTPKAFYGLMMAAATRATMERNLWGSQRFQQPALGAEKKPPSFGKG